MILEYCSNENLFYYAYLGRFIERQVKYFFRKILLGVQTLHAAGYCHRDLKLDNILLDQSFNPKITDFLFTTLFRQNNRPIALNDFIGPLIYFSPQILVQQPYNGEKADIFILGVILIRLITPRTGFETSKADDNCYQFIIKGNYAQYWNYWGYHNDYSNEFKDLYISMVSFNENIVKVEIITTT